MQRPSGDTSRLRSSEDDEEGWEDVSTIGGQSRPNLADMWRFSSGSKCGVSGVVLGVHEQMPMPTMTGSMGMRVKKERSRVWEETEEALTGTTRRVG